jgi:hypothetical protein
MMTATKAITSLFPSTPTLTCLTSVTLEPTYASIQISQTELNGNSSAIHSDGGDVTHGHLALLTLVEK